MIRKTLLALAALTLAGAVQASPYTFTGSFETDPSNIVITGLFNFDDSLVAAGGGDGAFDLSSLSVSFMGHTYSLSDAIDPYVQFEAGVLTGPNGQFTLIGGNALALQSFFGSSAFTYAAPNGDALGLGTLTISAASAVPEPAALALSLAGLGAAGLATTRRRRQTVAAAASV